MVIRMVKPMNTDRSQSVGIAGPDPSWHLLYRIGGISAWIFVAMTVAAIALAIATPPPSTAGGTATLSYIAAHRTLYIVYEQLWLVPGLFAMVTYLALYPALKNLEKSLAALGAVVGGSAWALSLAIPVTTTVTRPSALLRAGPPLCLASVLCRLRLSPLATLPLATNGL